MGRRPQDASARTPTPWSCSKMPRGTSARNSDSHAEGLEGRQNNRCRQTTTATMVDRSAPACQANILESGKAGTAKLKRRAGSSPAGKTAIPRRSSHSQNNLLGRVPGGNPRSVGRLPQIPQRIQKRSKPAALLQSPARANSFPSCLPPGTNLINDRPQRYSHE